MNQLLNAMQEVNNMKLTENGGLAFGSTMDGLQDLFALGGAYRSRTDEDCVHLFLKALDEDETYAIKCLFYLRDVRGGAGERRFFKVVLRWLARNRPELVRRNLEYIPEYGRWDDFYCLVDTPLEGEMFALMKHQLALDVQCKTPSLLAKWLKSQNTSSKESRYLARKTQQAFGMTAKEYRKTLSTLRERIRVLERLMSLGRFDEIEFDKIPSQAGLRYRNAFARRDILRARYESFAKDKITKVNADSLNPCDVVHQAIRCDGDMEDTERLMINKYWDNLKDYFHDAIFNGVAVVDTSGSMTWSASGGINPIDVAISLGMYCAEKCNPASPWYGNYITFSHKARLVPIVGVDFVDKVKRIVEANLCEDTNIESVFDLILKLAIKNKVSQSEMPKNIVIISDQEFNEATEGLSEDCLESVMEKCMRKWQAAGYESPHLVFWNVEARNDTFAMRDNGNVSFISGYSAVGFEMLMSGKKGIDLIKEKLDSERYKVIK
ncbi:MAG: DUF2828 domain-containing protein [Lachnospiraceae bacterium]|nr:DUF2828 domain-containing protein [Lachnospiraceae bacterium]